MSLNRRDLEILSIISSGEITVKNLATIFKITERNLRYSLENINFYLEKKIEINYGKIELDMKNHEIDNFFRQLDRKNYIFSKEEREEYILVSLLLSGEKKSKT